MTTRGETSRRTVRRIDPASVARLTVGLCVAFSGVVLVGLVALFLMAKASGALTSVESFFAGFGFGSTSGFKIRLLGVVLPVLLIELVFSLVVTAVAVATAMLYNAVADVVGGVEITSRVR